MSAASSMMERTFAMTKSRRTVETVLALQALGLSISEISRRAGVSRATVRVWTGDPHRALDQRRSPSSSREGELCSGCDPWTNLDPRFYAYLLGMYLGDGHISRYRYSYRLRIACDPKYPQIIEEVVLATRAVMQVTVARVRSDGCIVVSAYSQHWPCLFPQHGAGRKHERPIVLTDWQRQIVERYPRPFIRGLIHSDGWRGKNVAVRHTELAIERRWYTRYQFSNRSDDIREMFCWALGLVGVHWTRTNGWTIAVSRKKDVFYLDSFVGPKR